MISDAKKTTLLYTQTGNVFLLNRCSNFVTIKKYHFFFNARYL